MGIRYLAISIDRQDFDHLSKGTCQTCGQEPHRRRLDDELEAEVERLDLDKSWHYLQWVLQSEPRRPAADLVAGQVTNTSRGWISHQGLLGPAQVEAIAEDLATVSAEDVRQRILVEGRFGAGPDDRSQQDFEYVCDYLADAQVFTKQVAEAGRSILYWIG